jgi:hypothetical protein
MNGIRILHEDICKIGTKPPHAEVCVVGKIFWTAWREIPKKKELFLEME